MDVEAMNDDWTVKHHRSATVRFGSVRFVMQNHHRHGLSLAFPKVADLCYFPMTNAHHTVKARNFE